MKKLLMLISLLLALLLCVPAAGAQESTDSGTVTDDGEKKTRQIEDLKERLATKVAELRETKPAALHGKITGVTLTTVSVETDTKEVKIELTDGIKIIRYVKNRRTVIDSEDLAKGDLVSVIGEYDTTLDVLKGKVIILEAEQPVVIYGTVIDTNDSNYTVTVKAASTKNYVVDYERSTATSLWENGTMTKGGFSRLTTGITVAVSGFPVPADDTRLTALRILSLGVIGNGNTATPTAAESSASAVTAN